MLVVALVLARVLAEANGPAPLLSDEAILVLKRHDIRVGNGCGMDAGVGDGSMDANDAIDAMGTTDAGPTDAGVDGPTDAATDGGVSDAADGPVGDPCEHIPGDAITLVMQPHFSQLTTGARFAILMVTPSRPVIETTSPYLFDTLADASKPVIREIQKEVPDPTLGKVCSRYDGGGCGGGPSYIDDPYWDPPSFGGDGGLGESDGGYTLDQIGPYQVLRATPTTTAELTTWLTDLDYLVMPDDVAAVAPYIAKGYTVVALRVALDTTPDGQLSPIALTWAGSEIRLPAALGAPGGLFPTTVYIAADHRYDLPGATVPFAYRVGYPSVFLTRNEYMFDPTTVESDPIAIPIANDPEKREIIDHVVEVRVPVEDDAECGCKSDDDGVDVCQCSTGRPPRADWYILLGAIAVTMLPRRRGRRRR